MNELLINKKLLILGATANEIPVVKRAQELGVYVITTDYNKDKQLSPAKLISDEYWDISWSDINELKKKCLECGVDGIIAGFSEIRVDNQIKLCRELGLPCYINEEQLEVTRNKFLFKKKCQQFGVPVIKENKTIDEVNHFPVIVKPVDRAGSIGVSIANNHSELEIAVNDALDKSISKRVIIEDYITNSIEMDVHYAIMNGEIFLLVTDDIIPAKSNVSEGKVFQSAWLYPSKYEKAFLTNVDPLLRKMIEGMQINNGTIFFSGFVNEQKEFKFFECGFRLWGEQEFSYDSLKGSINYLDVYIFHALTGSTKGVVVNENKNEKLKGIEINIYSTSGIISKINGFETVCDYQDCYLAIQYTYCGKECHCTESISPKHALFGFANESPQQLKNDVDDLYSQYDVFDKTGSSMIVDQIDTDQILTWWQN